jgi:hypothetical protein
LFANFYSNSEDLYKRRLTRSKVKGVEKPFNIPIQDRSSCCKFPLIKFILVVIIGGTIVSLLYSPDVDQLSHSGSRYISCLFTCFWTLRFSFSCCDCGPNNYLMQGSGAGSYYISGKIVTMVKKKKKIFLIFMPELDILCRGVL